jgi:uncharacterized protein
MIDLRRDPDPTGPVITGFSGTGFRVQDTVFNDGLMLTPVEARAWTAPDADALTPEDIRPLLDLDPRPEFLLLGTGSGLVHPPRAFVRMLEDMGIGVEVMDSRAAARAWGVLRAEGRWIAGAFLPL